MTTLKWAASLATYLVPKPAATKAHWAWPKTKPKPPSPAARWGPITFPAPLKPQEEIFSERMSILFKKLRVVRMVDRSRNTLVYLTYSERVVEGSPQNSVTAVAVDRATPIPVK